MDPEQILAHFRESGALLEGHFLLSSGLHSGQYLQCALALQYPSDAARFGRAIGEHFVRTGSDSDRSLHDFETVASPAIGGLIVGYAVAAALNKRFIWTERQEGKMILRRGFSLQPGEKILVVEDVITTGGSTRECIASLEENGGKVITAASIIDRSNGQANVGVPSFSLVTMDVQSYWQSDCPMCADGGEPYKPGSRK
jgi:orotate phosphoribosyltransferase